MFTLSSGTDADVYAAMDALDAFLVSTLGWTRQYTIGSYDKVYYNNGGEIGNEYSSIYARWRVVDTAIYQYSYSYFNPSTGIGSNEMGGTAQTANFGPSVGGSTHWFVANKDMVWVILRSTTSGTYFSSSIGYCESYYSPYTDTYPVCVTGQLLETYDFTNNRSLMRNVDSVAQYYKAENYNTAVLSKGNPNARDGRFFSMPILLYSDSPGYYEFRGELKGIKQVNGTNFPEVDVAPLVLPTVSGNYLIIKHSGVAKTFAYGPLTV
jgi:hypothetical protein